MNSYIADFAKVFVQSKGRLPDNQWELAEWLVEFNRYEHELLQNALAAYQEHMNTCNRPFLIPNDLALK